MQIQKFSILPAIGAGFRLVQLRPFVALGYLLLPLLLACLAVFCIGLYTMQDDQSIFYLTFGTLIYLVYMIAGLTFSLALINAFYHGVTYGKKSTFIANLAFVKTIWWRMLLLGIVCFFMLYYSFKHESLIALSLR